MAMLLLLSPQEGGKGPQLRAHSWAGSPAPMRSLCDEVRE